MPKQTAKIVDHLFRNEFGKAVAYLTSKFGTSHLETAEDAVQEALIQAIKSWSFGQIPDNPSAWIVRVAKNKLIDHLRKQQKVYYATQVPETAVEDTEISEGLFKDEVIKMMFACCNPALSIEYQLILTLKILGGLSIREIASALLKKEETIAKSYTRAKKKFRENNLTLVIPNEREIDSRLKVILKVIYLLFNEGYKTTEGASVIKRELCEEAMRLNQLLLDKPNTNNEYTRSLMALMLFQASRFDARINESGDIVSLEDQDRAKWSQEEIILGNRYMSTINDGMSNEYFIQAAISGIHCAAKTYRDTNWASILLLYNNLYHITSNPIVALNRIYPLAQVHGVNHALDELKSFDEKITRENAHLYFAILAELYRLLGESAKAIDALDRAIAATNNEQEKSFLTDKRERIHNNHKE